MKLKKNTWYWIKINDELEVGLHTEDDQWECIGRDWRIKTRQLDKVIYEIKKPSVRS